MYIKYNNNLYNASILYRIGLGDCTIYLSEGRNCSENQLKYKNNDMASFAYGRIITGLLGKWGCADVSPENIASIMEEVEKKKMYDR